MKRFKYRLLQLVLGLVVVSIVFWWPVMPLWERPVSYGRVLGFDSTNNQVLFLCSDPVIRRPELSIVAYDVFTGMDLERKIVASEKDWWICDVQLIKGSTLLIVVREFVDSKTQMLGIESIGKEALFPKTYEILDAITHQSVAGPFPFRGQVSPLFSDDGKWMLTYESAEGAFLINLLNGKTIRSFSGSLGRRPLNVACFSPDSSTVAIQWFHDAKNQWEIEVVRLPDGKTKFAALLPSENRFSWGFFDHWDEHRIYLQTNTTHPQWTNIGCISFEVHEDRLGELREEPLSGFLDLRREAQIVQSTWKNLGDYLIQLQKGTLETRPAWLIEFLKLSDKKLGTNFCKRSRLPTLIRIVDRSTGNTDAEFSSPRLGYPHECTISPDIKFVASFHNSTQTLQLWNSRPSPRWLWCCCGVMLAVLPFRLIRSLRDYKQLLRKLRMTTRSSQC